MDWFSLWFNGAYMAVQGFLQVCFSGWITGKRPQARHVALYLFLLSAGAFLPSGFLAAGAGLLSLYGVNRLMGNTCPAACVTAILAVYIPWPPWQRPMSRQESSGGMCFPGQRS